MCIRDRPTTTASENDMNNNPQPATGSLDVLAQTLAQLLQSNGQAAPRRAYDRNETPLGSVVISGTGLGLPGANTVSYTHLDVYKRQVM